MCHKEDNEKLLFILMNTFDGKFFTGLCGNWIEIAYGTKSGSVRVIVQHPETVGHGPQLFQTFTVHQSAVTKVRGSNLFFTGSRFIL